jgi:hypothetical protein
MKKRIIAVLGASALVLTMATSVFAADAPSYGATITGATGTQFGKLVQEARSIGHITNAAGGAKAFVEVHLGE